MKNLYKINGPILVFRKYFAIYHNFDSNIKISIDYTMHIITEYINKHNNKILSRGFCLLSFSGMETQIYNHTSTDQRVIHTEKICLNAMIFYLLNACEN